MYTGLLNFTILCVFGLAGLVVAGAQGILKAGHAAQVERPEVVIVCREGGLRRFARRLVLMLCGRCRFGIRLYPTGSDFMQYR